MACRGCGKSKTVDPNTVKKNEVMGGYGYLTDRQIRARLEVYKKKYCKDCDKRYECDYKMYLDCKKNK